MARFSKRIAVLALAAAAGCSDRFPPVVSPLDRFYFPVGISVRRLPDGRTALLVASTNFDLRYDFDVGGAVLAVDPDLSGNALPVAQGGDADPTLAVLGGLNIGSFAGEIGWLDGACAPLAADPFIAGGGAKVVVASRGSQVVYALDMDAQGGLACNGCAVPVRSDAFDPYGVATVCPQMGGVSKAAAYVTHLRSPGNVGWVSELDFFQPPNQVDIAVNRVDIDVGLGATYTSTPWVTSALPNPPPGTPGRARLFVSTRILTASSVPLRWFDVMALQSSLTVSLHNVASVVTGALTRKLAVSTDGQRGYLLLDLFDYDQAQSSGAFVPTGSALAVYDLSESALGQPSMNLLRVVPTCVGEGDVKVMQRAGQRDLVALTCDTEGVLIFYDDQVGTVVYRLGLDPATGRPLLGRRPFGLAQEARAAGQCTRKWNDTNGPTACTRLYVGAFDSSWVSLVELDPNDPGRALVGKRIGMERD